MTLRNFINGINSIVTNIDNSVAEFTEYNCIQFEGQSNISGREIALGLPSNLRGELPDIYIFNTTTERIEKYEAGVNSTMDRPNLALYGYEIYIATALRDLYNKPVIIFKFSIGGTVLAESSGINPDWNINSVGELTDQWESYRDLFLTRCAQSKIKPVGMSLVWHQGESDGFRSDSVFADAYQVNEANKFQRHIDNNHLGTSNRIVSVNVESTYGDFASIVRAAKVSNANSFTEVDLLDADGLPKIDVVHLSDSGLQVLGNSIFQLIKGDYS